MKTTSQIITLVFLACVVLDFIFILGDNMLVIFLLFDLGACLLVWDIIFKIRCRKMNRPLDVLGHNYPSSLSSTNGIGTGMLGNFKYAGGAAISYCVLMFLFIPVYIKGCYLAKKNGSTYTFMAEVEGSWMERLYVLSIIPSWILTLIGGIAVLSYALH